MHTPFRAGALHDAAGTFCPLVIVGERNHHAPSLSKRVLVKKNFIFGYAVR